LSWSSSTSSSARTAPGNQYLQGDTPDAQRRPGQFSQALANEGGILKVFWAGKTRSDQLRRMNLAVETETYEYELQVGFVEACPIPRSFSSTR
jgi:hypothetical protein